MREYYFIYLFTCDWDWSSTALGTVQISEIWMKQWCGWRCVATFLSEARGNDVSGMTVSRSRTAGCSLAKNVMQQQRKIVINLGTWAIGRNCPLWVSVLLATAGCDLSPSTSVLHVPKDMRMLKAYLWILTMFIGWRTERSIWGLFSGTSWSLIL